MSDQVFTGGCQCGAVRFRVTGLGRASLCHCRMCQKATGGIGGLLVTAKQVEWTRGAPKRFASSNVAQRGFCADCGTPLTFEYEGGIDIAIPTFDRPNDIPPTVQLADPWRLAWFDGLAALPPRPVGEMAKAAAHYASVASNQHPDHETTEWKARS
jgi:hypothetical protein